MDNKDVVFIRKNGRIIPIRKRKDDAQNVATLGAAAAISYGSGKQAVLNLSKSRFSYSKAAHFKGVKELVRPGPMKDFFRTTSATFKVLGKKFAYRSQAFAIGGAVISSALAARAVYGLAKDRITDEKASALSTAGAGIVAGIGLGMLAKKVGITVPIRSSDLKGAFKATSEIFKKYSSEGARKSAEVYNKIMKTAPRVKAQKWLK